MEKMSKFKMFPDAVGNFSLEDFRAMDVYCCWYVDQTERGNLWWNIWWKYYFKIHLIQAKHKIKLMKTASVHLLKKKKKPSFYRVRCENISALHAEFTCYWCPTPSRPSDTSFLSYSMSFHRWSHSPDQRWYKSPSYCIPRLQTGVCCRVCVQSQHDVQGCNKGWLLSPNSAS